MEQNEFKLSGATVRVARLLKGVSATEFAKNVGLSLNHFTQLEREVAGITFRNHFRILRELRKLGYTDQQLAAILILTENIEGVEVKR
ncbi:hypothetical protein [Bacillus sp. es.036]|uniref:hypothetical protein n=1 Tax=Bacillus sp. es.036 TaxID=1761764 RepID=UPI000BF88F7E|nr:hypothetical protein [Bacillus sp. es.036]PFG03030.1 hypothetical protein ATG70_4259 [Bacillus sp. es.036]